MREESEWKERNKCGFSQWKKKQQTNKKWEEISYFHILMCHICRLVAYFPISIYLTQFNLNGVRILFFFFTYFVENMNFRFYDNSRSHLLLSMVYVPWWCQYAFSFFFSFFLPHVLPCLFALHIVAKSEANS